MDKLDSVGVGEIQMQSFSDGLPPPPPVGHSWKRIDRFTEDNYEELFENIQPGATINDVNELEHELDCTLPQDVRESLQLHDGQERGGLPTGIIFGCMLLDCEEITQEWQNWRTVNEAYFSSDSRQGSTYEIPQAPLKAFAGNAASSSSSTVIPVAQQSQNGNSTQWRAELIEKQESQPAGAIQKAYAHPAWIPLARDWGGNNIAVDLAPGPSGRWGQIILMGRDYDCKYVVARSWAAFLATLADDMGSAKWWIDEDTKELKLREFKQQGVEPAYIDILRWRADQKYGRRVQTRRRGTLPRINSNVSGGSSPATGMSPYASPIDGADRGRSPHRNGKAPALANPSPRAHIGSPLARVAEEIGSPSPTTALGGLSIDSNIGESSSAQPNLMDHSPRPPQSAFAERKSSDKLISLDASSSKEDDVSRRGSLPFPRSRLGNSVVTKHDDEDASDERQPLSPTGHDIGEEDEEGMREVKI